MRNAHLRSVAADDDGAFEFTMAPESPESMVKVEAVGFEYLLKGLPDRGDANIVLRLVPTDPGVTSLRGRVVSADGTSADGAWVAMSPTGMSVRVEDATGVFEIKIGGGETSIHAVLPGFLPARTEKTPGGAWPEELVLVLGSPALEIRGRVVDETGAPFAGLRVGVLDGSGFGATIEPGSGEGKMKRVEDMASAGGVASCTTSDEGAFRIDGLQPRMYRVLAFDPDRLFGATLSVQAGQIGVEIVIDRHAGTGTVQGRVTDQQGVPLPGVNVRIARIFGIEDHYNREPNGLAGASVATGPEGRFAFPLLALQDAELSAYGGLDFQYLRVPLSSF